MLFAPEKNDETPLFIRGAPDISETASLYIGPAGKTNQDMPLFIPAPPASPATLVIGRDYFASGSLSVYMIGHDGFGGTDAVKTSTLYIRSPKNNAVGYEDDGSLFIDGPVYDQSNSGVTLFTKSINNPPAVRSLRLTASGADPSSSYPIGQEKSIPLYIRNEAEYNANVNLHIENDIDRGNQITLFIKDKQPSGVAPLYVSGVYKDNNTTDLFIKAPQSSAMNLFNRGYRE